jgi:hypothetical protein
MQEHGGKSPGCKLHWLARIMAVYCLLPSAFCLLPSAFADDPLPLRRVLLPADRVTDEMKGPGQSALKQLPREEFEELVQRAARAGEASKRVPRLIEAHYRTRLVEQSLMGTGQWRVLNPAPVEAPPAEGGPRGVSGRPLAPGAAILPLSLNLALRQPRFVNQEALVADLDGKSLGLLLEQGGEQTVALDWSARGEPRSGGLAFDLEVPPCPVASLELDLPRDRVVAVSSDGCLLDGPHPAEAADHQLWKIGFAGRPRVRLTIRQRTTAAPLVLATLTSRQTLTPDAMEADFSLDLEVLRSGVRELRCELDPSLRPYAVTIANLESWQVEPRAAGAPSLLVVRLREPLAEGPLTRGALQVRCQGPLTSAAQPGQWAAPGLHLLGAVPRGETLELRLHPDVCLEDWRPGQFRVTESKTESGEQVLTLNGGSLAVEGGAQRPSAHIQTHGAEFRVRQLLWWQVAPPRSGQADDLKRPPSALTGQFIYEVIRGRLFQLPVALPPGWELDHLQVNPPDLLRGSSVHAEKDHALLLVELQRPLLPGVARLPQELAGADPPAALAVPRSLRLTVWLRPAAGVVTSPPLAFPDLVPVGARSREGALAIEYDESLYDARVSTSALPASPEEEGPWRKQVPNYFYPFRGRPAQGTLTLQPRHGHVRTRCTSTVTVTAERAGILTDLVVQPEVGSPDTLDLYVSAPVTGKWQWKALEGNNAVRSFERWPAGEAAPWLVPLGACHGVGAAALLAAPLRAASLGGERWRLTLARPLTGPLTLRGDGELLRQPGLLPEGRIDVPLLAVLGGARMEGEVRLYLAGTNLVQVDTVGLREPQGAAGPGANATSAWRVFHYGQPPLGLALRGQAPAVELTPHPAIDHVRLTTCAGTDGQLFCRYSFEVGNWQQRTLPLGLPAGARPLALRVDGRWIMQVPLPEPGKPGETALPLALKDVPVLGGVGLVPAAQDREDRPANSAPDDRVGSGGIWIELPVPAGAGPHRYAVVYTLPGKAWAFRKRLSSPEPILPVQLKPLAFRRTWLLAPGVVPVQGDLRRLPAATGETTLRRVWEQGTGLWDRLGGQLALADAPPWEMEQRHALADAVAVIQREGARPTTLGEALGLLVFDGLREQGALVLDVTALREAGLSPATPLPPPVGAPEEARAFWERMGLVPVACRAGALLTTRRQAKAWRDALGPDLPLGAFLTEPVAEAIAAGHESSGRFRTVADWLQIRTGAGAAGERRAETTAPAEPWLPEALGPDWSQWEAVPGAETTEALTVVHLRPGAAAVGAVVAALLALAFWRTRRLGLLLVWLAVAALGYLWLPTALQSLAWWPLLVAAGLALAWYLAAMGGLVRRRPRTEGSSKEKFAALGATSALLLALLLPAVFSLKAAPPEPVTVFLVGPADAPDKQTVLAPTALLEQLRALAQRGVEGLRGPILVNASYKGEVKETKDAKGEIVRTVALFEATLAVHSFTEEAAALALPFAGVQLEEVLLDGAQVLPQPGYSLQVKGAGAHMITLRFRVPVESSGDDRDLQFTVPRLVQNRLALTVPEGARYLQALVKQGAVLPNPEETHLEVDLGRINAPLHFHWRQEAHAPAATLKVQELYLWDLSVSASNLTAILQYAVRQGSVPNLEMELPESLEVRNVEVGALGDDTTTPRLKAWQVLGTTNPTAPPGERRRPLHLTFQSPITAGVQVTLDLVPRRPLVARELLPLPAPLGAEATNSYLAYRLHGLTAALETYLRQRPISLAEFSRPWQAATGSAPPSLDYVCEFVRKGGAPALGPNLQIEPVRAQAVQDLAWRAGPQQVDLRAALRVTAPQGDLTFVEWEVPETVTVTQVSGLEVRSWSRSGSRVQVWLRRSVAATELQLSGWWLPPTAPIAAYRFELPRLEVHPAQEQTTLVRLTAGNGLGVAADQLHKLWSWPDARPPLGSDQELAFLTRQLDYDGTFRIAPAVVHGDVRMLTLAEVRDRQLTFTAFIDCALRQEELRALTLQLRNWEGDAAVQKTPEMGQVRSMVRNVGDAVVRRWSIDFQSGVTGHCRLTLTGSMPVEEATNGIALPEVSVLEAVQPERWLAVIGPDLTAEAIRGLTAVPEAVVPPLWNKNLPQGPRTLWKIAPGQQGNLRVVPRSRAAAPAQVQVCLTEHSAAVLDGRHWLHQATYWLYHEASTDLGVTLPEGATIVGVDVDGTEITALQPEPGARSLWLPLPGGMGARCLRLRWIVPRGGALLTRPKMGRPRLEDVAEGPVVWTIHVPAGFVVAPGASRDASPPSRATRAGLELRRAAAQLRLTRALASQGQGRGDAFAAQLALAQYRFYLSCRYAEHWLAITPPSEGFALLPTNNRPTVVDMGPQGQSLADWLQELQEENRQLARTSSALEAGRAEAQRQARAGMPAVDAVVFPDDAFAEQGTPLYWQSANAEVPAPALELAAVQTQSVRRSLAISLLLLFALLAVWVLSYFPGAVPWVRSLWPEQVVLLGCLLWQSAGPHTSAAYLVLLGIGGRLLILAWKALASWRAKLARSASEGSSLAGAAG